MFKKFKGMALLGSVLLVAGCATTGPNHQADIDALNARITSLQGELAEKDSELSKLKNGFEEERLSRQRAEAELRSAEEAKRELLASKNKTQEYDSDLK